LNGSVEHLGQSHDYLRRSQNVMAWTTAIFGALLLSGLVWIANDIFHLKDQLMATDRRFDEMESQMTAVGGRIEELNITIEQLGAELLAARSAPAPVTGPDVSVLSTPDAAQNIQTAANPLLEATAPDAAAQPSPQQPAQQQTVEPVQQQPAGQNQQLAALAPAGAEVGPTAAAPAAEEPKAYPAFIPSPPAPREQLSAEELATPGPVIAAAAPAPEAAPAAASSSPAAAASAAQPAGADLSDDQLLSYDDSQIDPADELLLLDESGNPQ
jgi:hypothetical protein